MNYGPRAIRYSTRMLMTMYDNLCPLTNDDLDLAFTEGHFAAVFQPKISLIDGRTLGVESYVRWYHPELGTLLPGEFLGFVAAAGRMEDLSGLMMHEAARVASLWRSDRRHWTVTINLGANDIDNPDLLQQMSDLFAAYALPTEAIAIDVPEAALTTKTDQRLEALKELKAHGIQITLETSGLDLLPPEKITSTHFTELKIGGTGLIKFARSVAKSHKGIIAERLNIAIREGLSMTATRVEDIDTIKPLANMGFSAAQGTFIHHPDTFEGLCTWSSDWFMPVIMDERPARADTLARARANLEDPDLLILPTSGKSSTGGRATPSNKTPNSDTPITEHAAALP